MTTINKVMMKAYERKVAEAEAAAARAEQTEKVVEIMMDQADELAYFALRLREILEFVEEPLKEISALVHTDGEITLERAENLMDQMEEVGEQVGSIFDAVVEICGGPDDQDDEDEDETECDCCKDIRRAEAIYDQASPVGVTLAPTASEDVVKRFLDSVLTNVTAANANRI